MMIFFICDKHRVKANFSDKLKRKGKGCIEENGRNWGGMDEGSIHKAEARQIGVRHMKIKEASCGGPEQHLKHAETHKRGRVIRAQYSVREAWTREINGEGKVLQLEPV